ncbi:MAG TPA: glycosyltransferase, partial [Candidatus Aminicenantes bacterium]|nr:glycosyltransferase [Candidatus Aminicenantes bacterium]
AALLFDGTDERSMTDALIRISNDRALCAQLVERGRTRVKRFHWSETARSTIRCYYRTHWAGIGANPLEQEGEKRRQLLAFETTKPLVMIVSHVTIINPSAGNELRLFKLIRHLMKTGYRVAFLYCPLDGKLLNEEERLEVIKYVDYFQQVGMQDRAAAQDHPSLAGDFVKRNQEPELTGLAEMEERFCPAAAIKATDEWIRELKPAIVIALYVWMSRLLKIVPPGILKVIDLIDKFSDKTEKVIAHGVADSLAISNEEEALLINRADLALAIQDLERERFRDLPIKPMLITTGIDFELKRTPPISAGEHPVALIVASGNALNVHSLRMFLEKVWRVIGSSLPELRLRVVGKGGTELTWNDPRVELVGYVNDVDEEYRRALFVINPVVAGTGLKIKSVEALAHGKALLSTPAGVEGLPREEGDLFLVARDATEFQTKIRQLVGDAGLRRRLENHACQYVSDSLNPQAVYRDLLQAFDLFLKGRPQ